MQQLYQQLTTLLLTHQQKFYRLAYSYCHNAETATDMVQAAACKALENYTTVKKPQYLKTWFYRILINECLDYLRRSKRELAEDVLPAQAILELPPELKTILLLHYFEDLTLRQIAQITQTNENTVKSRLYSGLKKLRLTLEEDAP